MSNYSSRYGGGGGYHRDRGDYFDRRRDRGRSWYRSDGRNWTSYRGREDSYERHHDYPRYRRNRDEEIVLIRRDGERSETKKKDHPPPLPPPHEEDWGCLRSSPPNVKRHYDLGVYNRRESKHHGTAKYELPAADPVGGEQYSSNWSRVSNVASNQYAPALPQQVERLSSSVKREAPPIQRGADHTLAKFNSEQQEIINKCISNFKTRGDYDQIRRECMLDVDTKPAFINVMSKVTDITSRYLQTAQYHPNMDKAKMRENLKKSFDLSRSYQNGIESLVNQILIPKISTILSPMVEAEVYQMLGLSTLNPEKAAENINGDVKEESKSFTDYPSFETVEIQDVISDNIRAPSTSSMSCLPPMNVIMDSEHARSASPATLGRPPTPPTSPSNYPNTNLLVCSETDLQLHQDILEELKADTAQVNGILENIAQNENEFMSTLPSEETKSEKIPAEKVMRALSPDICAFSIKPLATRTKGGVLKKECDQTLAFISDTDIVATEDFKSEPVQQTVELINEQNGQHSESNHEKETMMEEEEDDDDDYEMEEEYETDEESPAFENFGEVSPVRVDVIPTHEFPIFPECIMEESDGAKKSVPKEMPDSSSSSTLTTEQTCRNVEIVKKVNCVVDNLNSAEASESLCKFLNLAELPHCDVYERKKLFLRRIATLSPSKGKTKETRPLERKQ